VNSAEVGMARVQKIVRIHLDDGARDFEHGGPAAPGPLVADRLQFGRGRIRPPVFL
jgi:hypothetical protein